MWGRNCPFGRFWADLQNVQITTVPCTFWRCARFENFSPSWNCTEPVWQIYPLASLAAKLPRPDFGMNRLLFVVSTFPFKFVTAASASWWLRGRFVSRFSWLLPAGRCLLLVRLFLNMLFGLYSDVIGGIEGNGVSMIMKHSGEK